MGKACGMYGEEEIYILGFGGDTWQEENTWTDLGIEGRKMIKRDLKETGCEG